MDLTFEGPGPEVGRRLPGDTVDRTTCRVIFTSFCRLLTDFYDPHCGKGGFRLEP